MLYILVRVLRYCRGADSMKIERSSTCCKSEKDGKKRPPMKGAGVFAVAVTFVLMQTFEQLTNVSTQRPLQSEIQIKNAASCTDIRISDLKEEKTNYHLSDIEMAKTMPVTEFPLGGRC